ncbi:glycosyltransferase, partial [Ursidibacter maritimus]
LNILHEPPDVVIVHNMGKLSLLCSLLRTTAKLISLEHVSFSIRPRYIRFLSKILYRRFNTIISLSAQDANEYALWHNNVAHINNVSPFKINDKAYDITNRNIIAIGRLTEQKNFQHLLYAWEKCYSQLNEWTLNIYGTGEDRDNLSNLILERKIRSVNLKGEVKNLEDIYKNSAFIVMSSKYEGLPMVLIEAQSIGLPIVSYDCPTGPSEIIKHDKDGLLVENQNIDELAKAILYLATNHTKRLNMSNNALSAAERFSSKTILMHWEKILLY